MHSEPKRSFRLKRSHRTADIRPGIGKCPSGSPSTARDNHMSNETRRKNRKQNLPLSESDRGRILLSIFLPSAGSSKAWGRGGAGFRGQCGYMLTNSGLAWLSGPDIDCQRVPWLVSASCWAHGAIAARAAWRRRRYGADCCGVDDDADDDDDDEGHDADDDDHGPRGRGQRRREIRRRRGGRRQ